MSTTRVQSCALNPTIIIAGLPSRNPPGIITNRFCHDHPHLPTYHYILESHRDRQYRQLSVRCTRRSIGRLTREWQSAPIGGSRSLSPSLPFRSSAIGSRTDTFSQVVIWRPSLSIVSSSGEQRPLSRKSVICTCYG